MEGATRGSNAFAIWISKGDNEPIGLNTLRFYWGDTARKGFFDAACAIFAWLGLLDLMCIFFL